MPHKENVNIQCMPNRSHSHQMKLNLYDSFISIEKYPQQHD